MISSASTKKTQKKLHVSTSYLKSKLTLGTLSKRSKVRLYTYEDIPLYLFIDIANEGLLDRLVITGKVAHENLLEAWEEIIKRNSEENGDFNYNSYFQLWQGYNLLVAQLIIVKTLLLKAMIKVDTETIEELKRRGYKLNPTQEKYAESINAAMHRSDNLVTKAKMKQSEMESGFSGKEKKKESFTEVIANLEFALGRAVEENIKLSKYNALKKLAKKKAEALTNKKKH